MAQSKSDNQQEMVETMPIENLDRDEPLRSIDNYELIRRLGGGGMGDVFLARHHKFRERYYAIKVLKKGLVSDRAMDRFEQEVQVAGQLNHPNIVFAQDAGNSDGEPYLVMEFISGCDLQELIKSEGPLEVAAACEMIRQAAIGLDYAYQQAGLTHRDIKPANLMLTSDQQIKVLDLGLARLREEGVDSGLTQAGELLGTPDYMAPEQWSEAASVTTTADVYSLACSLFTLLTGKPPFYSGKKSSIAVKMSAHLHEEPPAIESIRSEVPAEVTAIIQRGLAKSPKDRFQTPGELASALEPFATNAHLNQYQTLSMSTGADALIPTHSTQKHSESTIKAVVSEKQTASTSDKPKTKQYFVMAAIAIALVIVVTASIGLLQLANTNPIEAENTEDDRPAQTNAPDSTVSIEKFDILVSRNGAFEAVDTLAPLEANDPVRFSIEFDRPAYAKLFWIDAKGVVQEIFPNDPEQGLLTEGPVTSIESPIELDTGWPLTPAGNSELALLIVSEKPISDSDFSTIQLGNVGEALPKQVVTYEATQSVSAKANYGKPDDLRSLGHTAVKIEDPFLQFLESLRTRYDNVRAYRIPMKPTP